MAPHLAANGLMRAPRPVIIAAFGGENMNRAIRVFALLFLLASPVLAQTPAPLLVDAGWLAQHLSDRDLVLLHVGGKAEYDAGHIAGARYITLEDLSRPHDMALGDLMLELPPPGELRAKVASFGISDDSRIVV